LSDHKRKEVEIEEDDELFIGPPPPALVAEAESANEAESFEEVTRIMGAESDCPYDVIGANRNISADNINKKYWKLSLSAHQAFVILNKALKDLQDLDKAELQAMREAAQWRRLQGISMEGDDELLVHEVEVKVPPKRDEWMTTLPPESKPGVTKQSARSNKNGKEGRGDTGVRKYEEDADLVDKYNKEKQLKSLVRKHQEEPAKRPEKKSDLTVGRQTVNLDTANMAKGLISLFSIGNFQRNFL
ncbi:hypothetical protein ERO13_A04G142550v2, partial [Gossypium hirsutum]